MDNKMLQDVKNEVENAVKRGELSRRDALKVLAFMSSGTVFTESALFAEGNETNATDANKTAPKAKADVNSKVVIVGGGSGGITVAARLVKANVKPENITIIEPSEKHLYQPGQTLIAAGIFTLEQITKQNSDYVPSGVNWIKEKVVEFAPDSSSVKLESGKVVNYDYLVVAAGLQYNFSKIAGLTNDMIGTNDIHSIYVPEKAAAMWDALQKFAGKDMVFTNPSTPIKCGGAPQKITYITESYLKNNGKRDGKNINFFTAAGKYFPVAAYHEAVAGFVKEKGVITHFSCDLAEVKVAEKIAIFNKKTKKKVFDPDLKEEVEQEVIEKVEIKYDLLHVTPPMSPVEVVAKSQLANNKGWMHVNHETLISLKFPNVFGIGDNIGTPFGKTGGSIRKQAPVLVENMIALMNGKEMTAKYNGYTVCPLITQYGKIMLAEFGYDADQIAKKEPVTKAMAMPSFPLDPTKERWIWWLLKVYLLPPMYWHGMLRGRA